ncbi:NADPH-dependent FMN reductase [Chitinophaga nivalis]|uniref:NAD(P)H-dependent oxidoreductase n=1 Tax=Chitinophaga nivalis TaxID=2991709 RepID=A0ABT3ITH0_9BACT|nr:NADPH-dependent FMN reductase [Chitinophaga nivalis]MCW3463039.1 NAD(P)H-dependent oxidoreductase [Chitinophaga nivalis]MCW3487271.1 NAD(P)H-dependent oxidoreductase [Chitinophaga nivalis]
MTAHPHILAISGSTRNSSSNGHLIKAISDLASPYFTIDIFEGIATLPHFNPDLDPEKAPEAVTRFRQQLQAADGILICTPEYAIGVPGSLKNAIDWTVSSMEFSRKPVALITASTSGHIAHKALLGTLLIIESRITAATQLVISAIKTKVNVAGQITDPETREQIHQLIRSLASSIADQEGVAQTYLPAPSIH